MEKQKNNKKLLLIIMVVLILLAGVSFAYFFANLRGTKINEINLSSSKVTYTEPEEKVVSTVKSEYIGMTSADYFEFSVTGESDGTANIDYIVYLEEQEGNTIAPTEVRVYLADENDLPVEGYYYENLFFAYARPKTDGSSYFNLDFGHCFSGENSQYNVYKFTNVNVSNLDGVTTMPVASFDVSSYDIDAGFITYFANNYLQSKEDDTVYVNIEDSCNQYVISSDEKAMLISTGEDESLCEYEMTNNGVSLSSNEEFYTEYTIKDSANEGIVFSLENSTFEETCDVYAYGYVDGESTENGSYGQYSDYKKAIVDETKKSAGESIYLMNVDYYLVSNNYAFENNAICKKHTVLDSGTLDDGVEVNLDECTNNEYYYLAKNLVTSRRVQDFSLTETEEPFVSVSTGITSRNSFTFTDGLSSVTGTNNETHNYRLRFWIDENFVGSNSIDGSELEETIDGNKHIVNFGTTGTYKFTVNVLARQN